MAWAYKNFGQISRSFAICQLDGQGRGLVAEKDIAEGETLFSLPRTAILNAKTGSLAEKNHEKLLALNQWQALILVVAYEWFLGSGSQWKAYFDVLPLEAEKFSSLMFWSADELSLLEPSTVLDRIGRKDSDELFDMLVVHLNDMQLDNEEFRTWFDRSRFHVVASLIMAYSFDVDHPEEVERVENEQGEEQAEEEDKEQEDDTHEHAEHEHAHEGDEEDAGEDADADSDQDEDEDLPLLEPISEDTYFKSMVPMADTLNADTNLHNATLTYEKDKLVMKAIKPIAKGEQIYNFYGELPNSEILRKYGYVEVPSSKFEFAQITMKQVMQYYIAKYQAALNFLKPEANEHLVTSIFELIENSQYFAEQLEEGDGIILQVYEIYAQGEILPEFIILNLIMTTILNALTSDLKWAKRLTRGIEKRMNFDLESLINRSMLKCHQMLELHSSLTKSTLKSIKDIVTKSMNQYPEHIQLMTELPKEAPNSKKLMADVVLFNEYKCLREAGTNFPNVDEEGLLKLHVAEDDKLLRNLLKRKLEQEEQKASKRHKK